MRMSDTQGLLNKIAALRQRLEQAQGLVRDVGSAAAALPEDESRFSGRVQLLEQSLTRGALHNVLLDSSLRQLPAGGQVGQLEIMPTQLTARASRLVKRGQDLLKRLRDLARDPLLQADEASPLAGRYRETVAMTDTVLRTVQAFPNAPSAQLPMCEGLEVILEIVADRLGGICSLVAEQRRDLGWAETLTELLTGLNDGGLPAVKPWVLLAESILNDAQEGAPLRLFRSSPEPAESVAAHSLNVAQVVARVVRHDADFRGRALDPVLAALVHDAGMLNVPASIFTHAGALDDDQRRAVEKHALIGAELALRLLPNASWMTEAAAGHHERLDGTGYPGGLRETQIGTITRLIAVCDVYAALCSSRAHRPALESRTALTDTLLLADKGVLDRFQAERLLQLSFYPVGTVVELADGAVGLVVATHQGRRDLNSPARPVLALLTDSQRKTLPEPRHVDLAECEGRSILRALPAQERRTLLGRRFPEVA
jgi:HD-GYP domain-containing protein (c-di-GMP phosphodiesterase class II)